MSDRSGLTERAAAKVNLFLHVVGRREDGYHRLDSLAVFAEIGDTLRARPADDLSLSVSGLHAPALMPESGNKLADNLVLRAARALAQAAGIQPRAAIDLEKQLPVASGLGGGSADAAAALRLLCRLWRLEPEARHLIDIATGLGADVPVCLAGQPARMAGIGEQLSPAPVLPTCGLVLANPGRPVSTPLVFRAAATRWGNGFSAPAILPVGWPDAEAMADDLAACGNDLEAAAIGLCPDISDVLVAIAADPNCLLARMSGSGATCFGLFADPLLAAAAAARLRRPEWWVWGGALTSATAPG